MYEKTLISEDLKSLTQNDAKIEPQPIETGSKNLTLIAKRLGTHNEPLSEIKIDHVDQLSEHDKKIVDFYNQHKAMASNLTEGHSQHAKISDKLFTAACGILSMTDEDIKNLKAAVTNKNSEEYLKKIDKAFRLVSVAIHPDRLDDKNHPNMTEIANAAMGVLGDAKEILLAFPKQFLSEILRKFSEDLEDAFSKNTIEAFISNPETQKILQSIDDGYNLSIVFDRSSTQAKEALWEISWMSDEFFPGLPKIIKRDIGNLINILFVLPENKGQLFWDLPGVMDQVADLLQSDNVSQVPGLEGSPPSASDLSLILFKLPADKIIPFLQRADIENQLPALIKNKSDIDRVLDVFKEEGKKECKKFIEKLPFVQAIMSEVTNKNKDENEFIQLNHPNLLKIVGAINQVFESPYKINEGTPSTPGYHLRATGIPFPKFLAEFTALTSCSEAYGFTVEKKYKDNQMLIVLREKPTLTEPKDDFVVALKSAYDKALVIEINKFDLKHIISPIKTNIPELKIERLVDQEGVLSYLKISGDPVKLLALNQTLTALMGGDEVKSEWQENCLMVRPRLGLEKGYEFCSNFEATYNFHLDALNKKAPLLVPEQKPEQKTVLTQLPLTMQKSVKLVVADQQKKISEYLFNQITHSPSYQALIEKRNAIRARIEANSGNQNLRLNIDKLNAISAIESKIKAIKNKNTSSEEIYKFLNKPSIKNCIDQSTSTFFFKTTVESEGFLQDVIEIVRKEKNRQVEPRNSLSNFNST